MRGAAGAGGRARAGGQRAGGKGLGSGGRFKGFEYIIWGSRWRAAAAAVRGLLAAPVTQLGRAHPTDAGRRALPGPLGCLAWPWAPLFALTP